MRARMMFPLWACLALLIHFVPGGIPSAQAQGSRKDDIVFNSRGIPLAGATVRVCAMPASGQPCTPLAQIYSDAALTQAIANPTTTDGLGNYSFFAMPGTYEIEISGPGITTKQLSSVILPGDPSNPAFSGAINLTNQTTTPGSPRSGTVNLYTKNTDKRLYYKDDTGTEIGPIASSSGAQTNAVNTFTAVQNFDSDVENKGPNPTFSLARYGGYSSATSTPPSTTGAISVSSSTLTLASAQDFANGQGILVSQAGTAPVVTTPGTPTVTPINITSGGSTTWNYKLVAEQRNGALSAASGAGTTTTGQATLGLTTLNTLTSCVRTNGVATYTTSAAHNLAAGTQVNIGGFTGGVFDGCNGVKTIAATPTSTTFTTNDGTLPNENNTTGTPVLQVYACNTLVPPSASYSGNGTIHYWIYRSQGAGSYSLVGVAQGVDPLWTDCGFGAPATPPYVPATPPSTTQSGYLATTILSGGGTTTLTLANAAGATVSGGTVLHDNSVPLQNAVKTADLAGGGTVFVPSAGWWVFNGTTDFTGLSLGNVDRVHFNTSLALFNNPIIPRGGMDFEGEPHSITSFSYVNGSQLAAGTAYPLFLLEEPNSVTSVHFSRLMLVGNQPGQSVIYMDSGSDGGGVSGIVFDDVNYTANGKSTPIVMKGGFDFFFNRGNCQGQPSGFVPQSCLQMTNASQGVTGAGTAQVPGRVKVKGLYFAGNAIDIDCLGNGTNVAPIDFTFDTTIFESAVAPYLRLNCPSGIFTGLVFDDVVQADSVVGLGTPSIDAQNDGSLGTVLWKGGQVNGVNQPAVITSANQPSLLLLNAPFSNLGNTPFTYLSGNQIVTSGIVAAQATGRVETYLLTPSGPSLAATSGGSVPTGTLNYAIQWIDVDGNYSPLSPSTSITISSGTQTVTVTPPATPAGAVAWVAYRNGAEVNAPPGGCTTGAIPVATNYVDTFSFTCGQQVRAASAGISILGPNGVSGPALRLVSNGNTMTFSQALSASRSVTIPDLSGTIPTTGYVNSAFDNATRANGAIGSNWTISQNNFNIAGNAIQGSNSAANNTAFWSANTFAAGAQFSQVTIASLNGTTDFPGVAVNVSGTSTSTQGYDCVEDTTNIFMQKIAGSGSNTTLTSTTITGSAGDVLRIENDGSGHLVCYQNGVSKLTATDTSFAGGQPGLLQSGNVATMANWSGGNLHPLSQLDIEADYTKGQHLGGNFFSCTMSAGTSCTATLTSATWHACIAQVQSTTATSSACSISGTTVTVTAGASNSSKWGILVY